MAAQTIRVDEETFRRLLRMKHRMESEEGRQVSMTQVVREAILNGKKRKVKEGE